MEQSHYIFAVREQGGTTQTTTTNGVPKSTRPIKLLRELVDLVGIEPTTSSMPWKRAPSCATGPRWGHYELSVAEGLKYSR